MASVIKVLYWLSGNGIDLWLSKDFVDWCPKLMLRFFCLAQSRFTHMCAWVVSIADQQLYSQSRKWSIFMNLKVDAYTLLICLKRTIHAVIHREQSPTLGELVAILRKLWHHSVVHNYACKFRYNSNLSISFLAFEDKEDQRHSSCCISVTHTVSCVFHTTIPNLIQYGKKNCVYEFLLYSSNSPPVL